MDDILEKIKKGKHEQLTEHLNQVDPTGSIKFTVETSENNRIACLDTQLEIKEDNSVKVTVYRKSTHMDRYLNFSSHHPLQQRLGVGRSLLDRKDSIVTEEMHRKEEEDHIKRALRNNGYKDWAIQKLIKQQNEKDKKRKPPKKKTSEPKPANRKIIVLPYMQGTTERLTKRFRSHSLSTAVKPAKTLRRQLVHMKDKIGKDNTCDCVYETRK